MAIQQQRATRRQFLGASFATVAGVAGIVAVGCGDDDEPEPAASPPAATPTAPEQKKLVAGWYRGREVKYYDFGANTKLSGAAVGSAPIWVLIHGKKPDGTPDMVQGQHNIIDVAPGEPGYSDLWSVNFVTVPAGYQVDSVKSAADVTKAGFKSEPQPVFVNCPVVAMGTTFEGGEKLVQGWSKGKEVFYPDFGPNAPAAVPIWVFITGMDDKGMPKFVKDQRNIIDLVPADAGYSAFWQVNMVTVPETYQPNSAKSADDVRKAGYVVTATQMLVNCPVTVA
ncbi:MAG: twin-arginine translocation signal domain-containing protein [Dehalococcoidia bacterium]